jgi:hypothetical protein
MSSFAQIDKDGIVQQVIIIDQDTLDTGLFGDVTNWIETVEDGSIRKQYASIGYTYDKVNDVFISPQPFPSFSLDSNFDWEPPIPYPDDDKRYIWNEVTTSWDLKEAE